MKHFIQFTSLLIISILLAGQYGYLAISQSWYTVYATLTGIGIIASSIASLIMILVLRVPGDLADMEPNIKASILAQSYTPLTFLNVPLAWIVLVNADYIVLTTLSVISTILLTTTISALKSKISASI